jgi:hypothetical protein
LFVDGLHQGASCETFVFVEPVTRSGDLVEKRGSRKD